MTTKSVAWTNKEIKYVEQNYGYLETREIAKKLNRSPKAIQIIASKCQIKPKGQLEYAIYFGDKYKFTGNQEECADFLNTSVKQFHYYKSPTYQNKTDEGIKIVDLGMWRIDE